MNKHARGKHTHDYREQRRRYSHGKIFIFYECIEAYCPDPYKVEIQDDTDRPNKPK